MDRQAKWRHFWKIFLTLFSGNCYRNMANFKFQNTKSCLPRWRDMWCKNVIEHSLTIFHSFYVKPLWLTTINAMYFCCNNNCHQSSYCFLSNLEKDEKRKLIATFLLLLQRTSIKLGLVYNWNIAGKNQRF